jgi:hypothetical protein
MPDVSTHPTAQALAQFGHGKLPEAQAATVATHLETCADCRQAVAALPPDSFLSKVRAAAPAAPRADVPPELASHPKFRIIRELGKGGMGVIYLAEHRVMDKPVALKVISPAVLDNPDALARFQAEARAAGKLDHPNIARAFDADQAGELHFLVMEYVEGMSLAQLLEKKGPLSVGSACHCACQAALGLQHAFEQGMAHRDIKPQNLMLTPKGQVKVLDFGLARLRGARAPGKGLTQADSFMGTPEYVAPEQATDARSADTRADIYSLGCTLYALLAGRPPFVEDTMVKLVLAHLEKEPRPLHEVRPDVPAGLSAVVAKMLAKDPAQRYQRPVEAAQALVPFVKSRARTGGSAVSSPPGVALPGTGTRVGGDTSKVKGLGPGAPKLAAGAPALPADAPASTPTGKKPRKGPEPAKPLPAAWWKRPPFLAGAAVVLTLALIVLGASGVLVKTKYGTIVLQNLPADAEVTIDGDRATLKTTDGSTYTISVAAGKKQRLEVKKDGLTMVGEEVEIAAGDRRTITVRLERKPAPAPQPDGDGFVSLFNGKDLTGWVVDSGDKGAWEAKDGELAMRAAEDGSWWKQGYLLTERDYADFHLRFQFRRGSDTALSGLALRAVPGEVMRDSDSGMVGRDTPFHLTAMIGAFPGDHPNHKGSAGALWWSPNSAWQAPLLADQVPEYKPAGEWNDMEVKTRGQSLWIAVNGREVLNVMLNKTRPQRCPAVGLNRSSGRIGFLKRSGEVRFRKIEIKELSAAKAEPAPTAKEPEDEAAGIARLRQVLLDHTWYYHDNLYPPGETFRFYADGTFHDWRWKYWVVGPRMIRVHYDRSRDDKDAGIPFTFNEDLTKFAAEFTDPRGRVHKIDGTRQ